MYLAIKQYGENEIIIDKSRFISYIDRATTEAEAVAFINKIKKLHYNANHNCSAYIIGEDKLHQKASDDGEPSKTAGVPMLEVLRKNNLTDTVCVVTRYFGGIKLGAGGLIRAYGNSVALVIQKFGVIEKKKMQVIEVEIDYSQIGLIDNKLSHYQVINKNFLEKVYYSFQIELDKIQTFIDELINVTSNQIKYKIENINICEVNIDNNQ